MPLPDQVNVTFSHPLMKRNLDITTNPDQITWAYGLNTAVYPTFGGEVVQILSVYFDDLTIAGTVSTYAEMEAIYSWFIAYMQYATQGRNGSNHDQHPVQFYYPERGWSFQIWPKSLPGFTYGTDVVVPTWELVAAVKEPDATLSDQIKNYSVWNAAMSGSLATFGVATADFGKTGDLVNNPWASPDADPALKGTTMAAYLAKENKMLADTFSGFVTNGFTSGNLTKLPEFPDISKAVPAADLPPKAAKGAKPSVKSKKAAKVR